MKKGAVKASKCQLEMFKFMVKSLARYKDRSWLSPKAVTEESKTRQQQVKEKARSYSKRMKRPNATGEEHELG